MFKNTWCPNFHFYCWYDKQRNIMIFEFFYFVIVPDYHSLLLYIHKHLLIQYLPFGRTFLITKGWVQEASVSTQEGFRCIRFGSLINHEIIFPHFCVIAVALVWTGQAQWQTSWEIWTRVFSGAMLLQASLITASSSYQTNSNAPTSSLCTSWSSSLRYENAYLNTGSTIYAYSHRYFHLGTVDFCLRAAAVIIKAKTHLVLVDVHSKRGMIYKSTLPIHSEEDGFCFEFGSSNVLALSFFCATATVRTFVCCKWLGLLWFLMRSHKVDYLSLTNQCNQMNGVEE